MKWGECGHPLCWFDVVDGRTVPRHTPWCRVCWTAEQTTEAINARAVAKKITRTTVKVTAVGPNSTMQFEAPKPFTQQSLEKFVSSIADVSGFQPGMTVDFFDGSDHRAEERARWRGRETEANAWEERALISRAFMRSLGTSPSTAEIAGYLARVDPTVLLDAASLGYLIVVDSEESAHLVEAHERWRAARAAGSTPNWLAILPAIGHTVPPILRPAYDVDGRPLARPLPGSDVKGYAGGIPFHLLMRMVGARVGEEPVVIHEWWPAT